ncbi:MAG TPA: phosphopyruvate hydratase, partial [Firmicutes bacterium]|nr:phosphopyruvate hydratase [Bacillota bacterium]
MKRAIQDVFAREVLDCRGNPTVQVDVVLNDGTIGRADVPAGLSTGAHEASELRDGGARFAGLGVKKAVKNVAEVIGPKVKGLDVTAQRHLDRVLIDLDGSKNKSRLGANAILGVSLASARAAANSVGLPLYRYIDVNAHVLPVPLLNLINGGKHASNDLEFQEFCIFPIGAETFMEALEIGHAVYAKLREIIVAKYGKIAANVGDEGGFAPPITKVREALDCLVLAVERSGYASKIVYGLDCAATHLYDAKTGLYTLEGEQRSTSDMIAFYKDLLKSYQIVSIEDPLAEDDVDGFIRATAELGIQIVGDDFFVTNAARIKERAAKKAGNALLWKVNQIGTLTEALDAAEMAFRNNYGVMVSERSGETEDP